MKYYLLLQSVLGLSVSVKKKKEEGYRERDRNREVYLAVMQMSLASYTLIRIPKGVNANCNY